MTRLLVIVAIALATLSVWFIVDNDSTPSRAPILVTYHDLAASARKEVDCLADNIYFEARSEPHKGKVAVALVTLNRVHSRNYPSSVCAVVREQRNRVCQFSWWCDSKLKAKSLQRKFSSDELYEDIRQIALDVYINREYSQDITKGALFYHAEYVPQSAIGVKGLVKTSKIGRHIFYRKELHEAI